MMPCILIIFGLSVLSGTAWAQTVGSSDKYVLSGEEHVQQMNTLVGESETLPTVLPVESQVANWLLASQDPLTKTSTRSEQYGALQMLMEFYDSEQILPRDLVMNILDASIAAHRPIPNVAPITRHISMVKTAETEEGVFHTLLYTGRLSIVGDTHGQYEDFAQIFRNATIGGYPSELNQFVFNGDIVDRGPKAVEILMVLLFAKLLSPNAVHIVRGNHETEVCTAIGGYNYGFEREVLSKYDADVYSKFHDFFHTLPFAAVVEDEVFVVHGGLGGPAATATIEEMNQVNRFGGTGGAGDLIDDMLWSDPHPDMVGTQPGIRPHFGADVTKAFLTRNNLKHLVRSHQVQMGGYSVMHDVCITVFSAPNYCGQVGNLGAVIRYEQQDNMQPTVITFAAAPKRQT